MTGMVIINYNDLESIINLLNNIKDYKAIDKIIIVDNNSKKEYVEPIKEYLSDKIELIVNKENLGFSKAINIGCKRLIDLYKDVNIIVSNSDVIINSNEDILNLISYLNKEDIGLVGPTIKEKNRLNRGWKNPGAILSILLNIVYFNHYFEKKYLRYKDNYYKGKYSYVDVVSGCFFLIKSETLKQIDYLDSNTFLYYEENILAKKIANINKKTIVVNEIKIIHNHSVSIDKNVSKIKKLKLQKDSAYYFETKYNKMNLFEKILFKITEYLSIFILSIVYFIKDLVR